MKWLRHLRRMFQIWSDAKASTLGAALAYYTLFSIAPLLVIALAVAGWVFGPKAAGGYLAAEIEMTVGHDVAAAIQELVQNANRPQAGTWAVILGCAVLFIGASGVFNELQTALNAIWEVKPKEGRPIRFIMRDRVLSFTMVLGTAFLLLISLVISAALSAISRYWTPDSLPGGTYLWQTVNTLVSLMVVTIMFALIYKYLPDVKLTWQHVWTGALATSALFVGGKYLLGLYLAYSGVTSAFGAAGSLALVLIWVYYNAQIFLLGAAFTRVYSESWGKAVEPTANAVAAKRGPGPMGLEDKMSF